MTKIANIGFFAPKPYLKGVDPDFLFDRKFFFSWDIETLKAAWRLEERIFHNIEKHENNYNGKKWPKLQTTKQTNKIIKFIQ